eukprot:gb/GEZN01000885.1/.p1 GENE.gb/GEZN01000885.1/~~gb/GEZN01000885.1/.p1  ORF type:complete len:991 (-),score=146.32 gb/GEZN01000885.1/:475-3447(-)
MPYGASPVPSPSSAGVKKMLSGKTKSQIVRVDVEVVLPTHFESMLKTSSIRVPVGDFESLCNSVAAAISTVQAFTGKSLRDRYYFSFQEDNDTPITAVEYMKYIERKSANHKGGKVYLRSLGMRRGMMLNKDTCTPNRGLSIAEGWLKKLSPSSRFKALTGRSIWQKRFFRLEEDHIQSKFMYAKTQNAPQFRFVLVMEIEHVTILTVMKGFRFTITTRAGKAIQLMGYSPKEVSLWAMHIVALQEKIKKSVAERGSINPTGSFPPSFPRGSSSQTLFIPEGETVFNRPDSKDTEYQTRSRRASEIDVLNERGNLAEQLKLILHERGLDEYCTKLLEGGKLDLKDMAFIKEEEEQELFTMLNIKSIALKSKFRRLLSECRSRWAKEVNRQESHSGASSPTPSTTAQPVAFPPPDQSPDGSVNPWVEFETTDGKFYYYNSATKNTSWPVPGTEWRKLRDKDTGRLFYRNKLTFENTWSPPAAVSAWNELLRTNPKERNGSIHARDTVRIPRDSMDTDAFAASVTANMPKPPDDRPNLSINPGAPTQIRARDPTPTAITTGTKEGVLGGPLVLDKAIEEEEDVSAPSSGVFSAPSRATIVIGNTEDVKDMKRTVSRSRMDSSTTAAEDYYSDEDTVPTGPTPLPDQSSRPSTTDKGGKIRYLDEEYDIQEDIELGSGVSSVVKLAIKKSTNEEVAVKIIGKNQGSIDDEVFREEIRLLRRIHHPNIICMLDVYESSEHMYLVVELAFGGELFDRILEFKQFNETQAKGIIRRVLSAVKHIHSFGIVHRDIKPENILFSTNSIDAELKLSDFGFAKDLLNKGDALQAQVKLGTKGYAAPEVWKGEKYDEKCDIWSLGVLTYILLSGVPPFVQLPEEGIFHTPFWIYCNQMEGVPAFPLAFPKQLWKGISDEATSFIKQCLQLDPKKRARSHELYEHPWLKLGAKKYVSTSGRRGSTRNTIEDFPLRAESDRHKRVMSTIEASAPYKEKVRESF